MGRQTRSGKRSGFIGDVPVKSESKKGKKTAKSKKITISINSNHSADSVSYAGKRKEQKVPSVSHKSPDAPVPRASLTPTAKRAGKEADEEVEQSVAQGSVSSATPPQTEPPDPALVLSYYCEMAELLNRGEWAEFKKVYDSDRMKVITLSPHADVLIHGISLRLQRYREQTLQQGTCESEDDEALELDRTNLAGAGFTNEETLNLMEVDMDDAKQQEDLAIKIVAEAVGEQLYQLLQDKLHTAVQREAGTAPLNTNTGDAGDAFALEDEEEEEVRAPDAAVDIRSRPASNAISRAGKRCKIDSKNRLVSRPAVQRDEYGYGGTRRVKWSEDEEEALITGITKYKGLKWAAILIDPEFAKKLALRKNTDLKDKYMVLRKRGEYDFSELDRVIAGKR